jgi:hypothetical protein
MRGTDEVARNGALQRINFGQRFSWAPLAFWHLSLVRRSLPILLPSPLIL